MTADAATDATGLPRLPADASAAEIRVCLKSVGAVVIDNAIDPSALQRLDAQLSPIFDLAHAGRGAFLGRRTRRFSALFSRAPATIDLALHPEILAAVETILRGDPAQPSCDKIQINLTQAIAIDPGEPAQALHRDESLFPARLPYELMVNVLWTLDAFTEANGATRLVPFSHKWPKDRRGLDEESVAAVASPGSAIIWLGSTVHGGGANRTSIPRRGLVISYSLGWLAQAEKLLLSIPPKAARSLPPRLQQLIGYQVHRPNLGWIEGRDPIEWLDGRTGDLAAPEDHLTDEIRERVERALASRAEKVT